MTAVADSDAASGSDAGIMVLSQCRSTQICGLPDGGFGACMNCVMPGHPLYQASEQTMQRNPVPGPPAFTHDAHALFSVPRRPEHHRLRAPAAVPKDRTRR